PHEQSKHELAIDVFDYPHVFLLPRPVKAGNRLRHVAIYGGFGGPPRCGPPDYVPGITLLSLDPDVPVNERFARRAHAARPHGGKLHNTTASMTADGLIMIMGGGDDPSKDGQRIDVYNPDCDSWTSIETHITRDKPSSTLLPDGKILIVNG